MTADMRFRAWLPGVVAVIGRLACGGSTPPAEPPPKEEAPAPPPPPPAEEPAPAESAEPAAEPAPEPAPSKPASKATISGISISDVEGPVVVAAMQKLGWAPESVEISGGNIGKFENIRFTLAKDGTGGSVEIVRPAHSPQPGASMMSPEAQRADAEKRGAAYYDPDADVLVVVVVDGKPGVAKQLLGKLVQKP